MDIDKKMNLQEQISRIKKMMDIGEMAYPTSFDMEHFKSLTSHKARLKYAKDNLQGKLGAGSSRAVFKIDDEKVLKIALNNKGTDQNNAEDDYILQNYDCIAKVYDSDTQNYTWIEMELAKKITLQRFQELLGFSLEDLTKNLAQFEKTHTNQIDHPFSDELIEIIESWDYPIPGDFAKIDSYGEVVRDGKPTVVLIDYGFNSFVQDIYYPSKKQKRY